MRYEKIGWVMVIFSLIILVIAWYRGKNIEVVNFISVLILASLLFIFPLPAVILLIPVTLLLWFRYYSDAIGLFNDIKAGKIRITGERGATYNDQSYGVTREW